MNIAEKVGATYLFVGWRDQGVPGEVPPARQAAAEAQAALVEAELRAARPFAEGAPPAGATVLDLITSPGEPSLVGWHTTGPDRHAGPAGRYAITAPPEAPSRAWSKLVEGLLWSGLAIRPGERVLEIGAAPGGATLALLERGAEVLAVDTNPMDPRLLSRPGLHWRRVPASALRREDLPADLAWIVCDANIPPAHAVRAVLRLLPAAPRLRGLLLTLKLNDEDAVASLPEQLEALRAAGASAVRARQLPSNRRDVFVAATWSRPAAPAPKGMDPRPRGK